MQNTKILEMINNGQIEELKTMIQEEIFTDGLKNKPGAKKRYMAMKKYFSYTKSIRKDLSMPCIIDFEGEKYTSFTNSYSLVLTKETSGEMELFGDSSLYLNVGKVIGYYGEKRKLDFNKIITIAKGKGYSIIDNGESAEVWHLDGEENAPMVIKNEMGICVIFPFHYHGEKSGVTIIEVA